MNKLFNIIQINKRVSRKINFLSTLLSPYIPTAKAEGFTAFLGKKRKMSYCPPLLVVGVNKKSPGSVVGYYLSWCGLCFIA